MVASVPGGRNERNSANLGGRPPGGMSCSSGGELSSWEGVLIPSTLG